MIIKFKAMLTGFDSGTFKGEDGSTVNFHKAAFIDDTRLFTVSVPQEVFAQVKDVPRLKEYTCTCEVHQYGKDTKFYLQTLA